MSSLPAPHEVNAVGHSGGAPWRLRAAGALVLGVVAAALAPVGPALAAAACPAGSTSVGTTSISGTNALICEKSFTSSTTWTVPDGVTSVDVVVVGGGSGGNGGSFLYLAEGGGGGGGGEVIDDTVTVTPGTSITVTVGFGSIGANATTRFPQAGGPSSFGSITALGGGTRDDTANNGNASGNALAGGTGSGFGGGGGGGALATGSNGSAANGGAGGSAVVPVSGLFANNTTAYGGGGGGGGSSGTGGTGGTGAGSGGNFTVSGGPATSPGGGGGGAGATNGVAATVGGPGANGVVIVRFLQAPTSPTSLVATPGVGSASIAFTTGADGSAPITNYEYSVDGGSWTALSPADTTSPVSIPGLTNGTTYSIRLRAVSVVGAGTTSSAVSVTPSALATGCPVGTSAVANSNPTICQVTFTTSGTWTVPDRVTTVDAVVVGGGSGGSGADSFSGDAGGGGGGGQVRDDSVAVTPGAGIPVTVGQGSAGGTALSLFAAPGGASSFGTFTAAGGASGVADSTVGSASGSGNAGGSSLGSAGSGGGGAGAVGGNAGGVNNIGSSLNGGVGGAGRAPNYGLFAGYDDTYGGGGGGGGAGPVGGGGLGGSGTNGGGNGGNANAVGGPASAPGGGGGGAGSIGGNTAGPGANGIVIVRFRQIPGAPTSLSATAGSGQASIAFTPGGNGSSDISNYEYSLDDGANWTAFSPAVTSGPVSITGLTNGTTYSVQLRAVSAAGAGTASSPVSVTPTAPPSPRPPAPVPPAPPAPAPGPPLAPGGAYMTLGGTPQPVTAGPNAQRNRVDLTGAGFTMGLQGLGPDGAPLALGPGGVLTLPAGGEVGTSGTGYLGGTPIDVYLDPPTLVTGSSARSGTGTLLGTTTSDPAGDFAAAVELPADVSEGDHVIQIVGLSATGSMRAVSLGITVAPDALITLVAGPRESERKRDRISASGTVEGLPAGTLLTPFVRVEARPSFVEGAARIVVQADGTFRWSRLVRAGREVAAYVAWTDTQSNEVTWRKVG